MPRGRRPRQEAQDLRPRIQGRRRSPVYARLPRHSGTERFRSRRADNMDVRRSRSLSPANRSRRRSPNRPSSYYEEEHRFATPSPTYYEDERRSPDRFDDNYEDERRSAPSPTYSEEERRSPSPTMEDGRRRPTPQHSRPTHHEYEGRKHMQLWRDEPAYNLPNYGRRQPHVLGEVQSQYPPWNVVAEPHQSTSISNAPAHHQYGMRQYIQPRPSEPTYGYRFPENERRQYSVYDEYLASCQPLNVIPSVVQPHRRNLTSKVPTHHRSDRDRRQIQLWQSQPAHNSLVHERSQPRVQHLHQSPNVFASMEFHQSSLIPLLNRQKDGHLSLGEIHQFFPKVKIKELKSKLKTLPGTFVLEHPNPEYAQPSECPARERKVWVKTSLALCKDHIRRTRDTGNRRCPGSCSGLHVCRTFLLRGETKCRFSKYQCLFGHDLHTEHNQRLLNENYLDTLSEDDLRKIFQRPLSRSEGTMPQICFYYNGSGCLEQNCKSLHICAEFIRGECTSSRCRLSHDMGPQHTAKILAGFAIDVNSSEWPTHELKRVIKTCMQPRMRSIPEVENIDHDVPPDNRSEGEVEDSDDDTDENEEEEEDEDDDDDNHGPYGSTVYQRVQRAESPSGRPVGAVSEQEENNNGNKRKGKNVTRPRVQPPVSSPKPCDPGQRQSVSSPGPSWGSPAGGDSRRGQTGKRKRSWKTARQDYYGSIEAKGRRFWD